MIKSAKVHGGVHEKHGGIGDAASPTVGTNNTNGMQCSTVTLRRVFWRVGVTILGGQTIRQLLGLSVTWAERFWVVVISCQGIGGLNVKAPSMIPPQFCGTTYSTVAPQLP
jgi:hypothetical protein